MSLKFADESWEGPPFVIIPQNLLISNILHANPSNLKGQHLSGNR